MAESASFSSTNEASLHSTDPAHLAFLIGKINKFPKPSPRGNYPRPTSRPQRKPHVFTETQRFSYEFLKSWSQELSEGFTANELKKAFRLAAIAVHPDHGGSTQLFLELKQHYATLSLITPLK